MACIKCYFWAGSLTSDCDLTPIVVLTSMPVGRSYIKQHYNHVPIHLKRVTKKDDARLCHRTIVFENKCKSDFYILADDLRKSRVFSLILQTI